MKNSLTGEGYGRSRFGGKVCADLELHFRHPVSYEVGSGIHELRDQAMDAKWNMIWKLMASRCYLEAED